MDVIEEKKKKKSDIPVSSRPNQMTSSESESKGNCEILNSVSIFNGAKTHKTVRTMSLRWVQQDFPSDSPSTSSPSSSPTPPSPPVSHLFVRQSRRLSFQ